MKEKGIDWRGIPTLFLWTIFFIIGMLASFLVINKKTVYILADGRNQNTDIFQKIEKKNNESSQIIPIIEELTVSGEIIITLEEDIKADKILIEQKDISQELWIYIENGHSDFYLQNGIFGYRDDIKEVTIDKVDKGIFFKLDMNQVYEFESLMEEGKLKITYCYPREKFDKIIVIDPRYDNDNNIVTNILLELQQLMEQLDIKVYYIDQTEHEEKEQILLFVENLYPDFYIAFGGNYNSDTSILGTEAFYNPDFFIPEFGNVQLGDILIRNIVKEINGKGNGIFPIEDDIIKQMNVPSVYIKVGYTSSLEEGKLLNTKAYTNKIAYGIYNSILEVYNVYIR